MITKGRHVSTKGGLETRGVQDGSILLQAQEKGDYSIFVSITTEAHVGSAVLTCCVRFPLTLGCGFSALATDKALAPTPPKI